MVLAIVLVLVGATFQHQLGRRNLEQSWLWKSEQRDKWSFCSKAAIKNGFVL
jgi:hypothetical protein